MELTIFDVQHGSCALLIGDAAPWQCPNVALFDCGHDATPGDFRPSSYLPTCGIGAVEKLIISHYDEDHVSDLPALRQIRNRLPIHSLYRNTSMSPDDIRQLKLQSGPLEPGVSEMIAMATEYSYDLPPATLASLELTGVELRTFWIPYPLFEDPNNLSLVAFVHHAEVSIIFPGDLETKGWQLLLNRADFRAELARVNVFVTSHHGRSNGYCEEVFNYCTPDIFITSDTAKQYGTQEQRYDQHANGVRFADGSVRRTLTTRRDKHIRITTVPGSRYHIQANAPLFTAHSFGLRL